MVSTPAEPRNRLRTGLRTRLRGLKIPETQVSAKEITDLLEILPSANFRELTHVGDLKSVKQAHESHEGPLLSASLYPEDWEEIARIGGPHWIVQKERGFLRLLHQLSPKGKKPLMDWGLKHGFVQIETWWHVPTTTNEEDQILFCWSKTLEEFDPDLGEKPQKKKVPTPTPILSGFWQQRLKGKPRQAEPWQSHDALATLLVGLAHELTPDHPKLPDGLYWNEDHAPELLSAPRAGIWPSKKLIIKPTKEN